MILRFNFPAIFLERLIRSDLPVNLQALAYRADRNFMGYHKLPLPKNHLQRSSVAINGSFFKKTNGALSESDKKPIADNQREIARSVSDSFPSSSSEVSSNWGVFGKLCRRLIIPQPAMQW